ncbi:MAG: hypothetical protein GY772_32580, partial [bacterium]|nr:hypothetical protein [bacterium]
MDGAVLRDIVCRVPPHKAGGPDQWAFSELRLLPLAAFQRLAELLDLVEALGRWPSGLTGASVSMIPKPGAVDATGLRPIGLMPVVYRLWAAARQPFVRQWLRPQEFLILGGRPGVGAELAALEANIIASEALASGEHAAAAFLDVSKAYEGVDHALLAEAALAESFPARIVHLAIAAYRGPRRVVLSGTPASSCAYPRRGIVAGCPVAVALMGLYLLRPLRGLRDLGLSLVRGFVDDLALVATGPEAEVGLRLCSGMDHLLHLIRPLGLEPNPVKHQLVASSEANVGLLREHYGVEVGTHAVDLGTDFSVGPVD